MASYELVIIVAPTVEDDTLQAQVDTVAGRVTQAGGEVTKTTIWGRRRMAYSIKNYHEGHYVVLNLQLPTTSVTQIERDLKLSETVIRHLIVRLDD